MSISKTALKEIELLAENGPDSIPVARQELLELVQGYKRYQWLRDQEFDYDIETETGDASVWGNNAGFKSNFDDLSWVDNAIDSAIEQQP